MKTIAVLTNFSDRSEHAASYALHLAQKIKANILLFNSFLVPSNIAIDAQVAWPAGEYEEMQSYSEMKLKELCKKLEDEVKTKYSVLIFQPKIKQLGQEGTIANALTKLEENKEIILLVMGTHSTDDLSTFLMGNNCRQVIDAANLPLLVIPGNAPIKDIEQFAFATDITYSDVAYINALTSLAAQFTGEIIITNVNPDSPLDSEHDAAVHLFMNDVANEVNYAKISYRTIPNTNVKKGLEWLTTNGSFEMLVMVHRKSSFFEFFYKSSISKKMAACSTIPLLIYPYPMANIPLF
ncbi:MAG: universal stress protein [Mucilaginibacter sp.]|nr:universal stress protein [Mucilaginibacter sp.]